MTDFFLPYTEARAIEALYKHTVVRIKEKHKNESRHKRIKLIFRALIIARTKQLDHARKHLIGRYVKITGKGKFGMQCCTHRVDDVHEGGAKTCFVLKVTDGSGAERNLNIKPCTVLCVSDL